MIKRYTLDEMGELWTRSARFKAMLDVELLACKAMELDGKIPTKDMAVILKKADFDIERIDEIEKTTHHDVIAFVSAVAEKIGPAGRYIHMGLTSSDILDTALSVQMVKAADLLIRRMKNLATVLKSKARKYRKTIMMGRTHGIHAEPMTFGLKMALWYDETRRNIERLKTARENIRVGKLSGAVGTYSNIDPKIEKYVCSKLKLKPGPVTTQVIQRDRHAAYMTTLAVCACSLEKMATEIRNLQRTDIREVEEFFHEGQKGSSAMPHKRNPITAERISGLARVIRSNSMSAMENVALWHERDISHSSVERVIIPDSTILLHYITVRFTDLIRRLLVYDRAMLENVEKTKGLIYSQRLLLALIDAGFSREDAYVMVQRNAMRVWKGEGHLLDLVLADREILDAMGEAWIRQCFNLEGFLHNVPKIYKRLGI